MTITLNRGAVDLAEQLIERGDVVTDERDDWSEHAPSADGENDFVAREGWDAFATWHLGVDREKTDETKGRFSFPMGDFTKVHRCAIISMESRAAQHDHDEIAKVAKRLLEKIDARGD